METDQPGNDNRDVATAADCRDSRYCVCVCLVRMCVCAPAYAMETVATVRGSNA
jgi:hypothetical protein